MKSLIFTEDILKAKLEVYKARGEFVTRRVMKPQPPIDEHLEYGWYYPSYIDKYEQLQPAEYKVYGAYTSDGEYSWKSPYQPGEQVYIREPFRISSHYDGDYCPCYKIDNMCQCSRPSKVGVDKVKWLSPYALKADYARHKPFVVDVRPERLHDISIDDCRSEGIPDYYDDQGTAAEFIGLWDSISKPPFDWDSNPWVFRIHCKKEQK